MIEVLILINLDVDRFPLEVSWRKVIIPIAHNDIYWLPKDLEQDCIDNNIAYIIDEIEVNEN